MKRFERRATRESAGRAQSRWWWGLASCVFAFGVLLVSGPRVWADIKPKERERAPDAEGHGDVPKPQAGADPLEPIIELMRKVQQRLAEADAGRWTQAEQKRIAEALEVGGDAVEQLAKLIEEIEQNSQSASGSSGAQGSSSSGKRNQTRRQMRERRRDAGQKGLNPQREQGRKRGDGQRERRDRQAAKNNQRRRTRPGGDAGAKGGALGDRKPSEADRWGDLPMKEVREALDARRNELPPRWRKALERYYRRLAESER